MPQTIDPHSPSPILNGNDRPAISHRNGAHPIADEAFRGPAFGFVRSFLVVLLLLVAILLAVIGFLSWHYSMDVTVEGHGTVEPRHRHLVKAETSGILRKLHVRRGQFVAAGEVVALLDATDWRTELQKLDKDLAINRSRQRETERQIEQERRIRRAEAAEARLRIISARIQLERVVEEQRIYASSPLIRQGFSRKPVAELLPVRLSNALLRQSEADLDLAKQRLGAVEARTQELITLARAYEKVEQDRTRLQNLLAQSAIRAQAPGTVVTAALDQRVGDRVEAGEAIMELVGTDEWQARIVVQELDLPKIKAGQPARLYLHAFPHMEYKIFDGIVSSVPSAPTESSPAGDAAYAVKVSIQDPRVWDGAQAYSLAYGMKAQAKIVVERGRIIDLLWRRLRRSVGKRARHDFYLDAPAAARQKADS